MAVHRYTCDGVLTHPKFGHIVFCVEHVIFGNILSLLTSKTVIFLECLESAKVSFKNLLADIVGIPESEF